MLFEPGPWDKRAQIDGAHVFSKKRKLLYGDEHDAPDIDQGINAEAYGAKQLHRMHPIWRKNALKMLAEKARREAGEVKLFKKQAGFEQQWPGDLGKHHALVEELIDLKVLTIHQDEQARAFALVHREQLKQAVEHFVTSASAPAAAPEVPGFVHASPAAGDASAVTPAFDPADTFTGGRAGCVFKLGPSGLGYYRDGPAPHTHDQPLPDGWVQGVSPEGYVYYWHLPSSTSSWERPTTQPPAKQQLQIDSQVASALLGGRKAGLNKLQEESGAQVVVHQSGGGLPATVLISGTARAVETACKLIRRKADAMSYRARALPGGTPAAVWHPPAVPEAPNYDFSAVAPYLTPREHTQPNPNPNPSPNPNPNLNPNPNDDDSAAAPSLTRREPTQPEPTQPAPSGGTPVEALSALAAYGDSDEEDAHA